MSSKHKDKMNEIIIGFLSIIMGVFATYLTISRNQNIGLLFFKIIVIFFLSICVHEMGHLMAFLIKGYSISLFLLFLTNLMVIYMSFIEYFHVQGDIKVLFRLMKERESITPHIFNYIMGYIKIIILVISFIIFFKFEFELASIIINDKKVKLKKV